MEASLAISHHMVRLIMCFLVAIAVFYDPVSFVTMKLVFTIPAKSFNLYVKLTNLRELMWILPSFSIVQKERCV